MTPNQKVVNGEVEGVSAGKFGSLYSAHYAGKYEKNIYLHTILPPCSLKLIHKIKAKKTFPPHIKPKAQITNLVLTDNQRKLFTCDKDGDIFVW